jgi:hypothetical protein
MTSELVPIRHNRPTNDELHPVIYRSMIVLTVWLVLSVWVLFSRGAYVGLNLAVITFFFLILVAIPLILAGIWRRHADPDVGHGYTAPFREWSGSSFQSWTGGVSGREASVQILLPIGAVAIGMTVFGLVFLFTVPHIAY